MLLQILTFRSREEAQNYLNSVRSNYARYRIGSKWEVGQLGAGKNLKSIDLEDIRKRFKTEIRGKDIILMPVAQQESGGLLGSYA